MKYEIVTKSEKETLRLANIFGELAQKGQVILLTGDLGAGKTVFAKGLAKGLGINDTVNSPTFNIVKAYFKGRLPLFHIDAYRLEGNDQDIGLDEYIGTDGVCAIEWPIYISKLIPNDKIAISIIRIDEETRKITLEASGDLSNKLLSGVKEKWQF